MRAAGIPFHQISHLLHGTTTATNALIERSCPDAALVTTEGFRDTIEIGRQHRKHLYDPYQTKPKPIVTKTDTEKAKFYAAEEYHQDFAVKNPTYPYIVINDRPKVEELKTLFPDYYRETPMTVAAAKAAGH